VQMKSTPDTLKPLVSTGGVALVQRVDVKEEFLKSTIGLWVPPVIETFEEWNIYKVYGWKKDTNKFKHIYTLCEEPDPGCCFMLSKACCFSQRPFHMKLHDAKTGEIAAVFERPLRGTSLCEPLCCCLPINCCWLQKVDVFGPPTNDETGEEVMGPWLGGLYQTANCSLGKDTWRLYNSENKEIAGFENIGCEALLCKMLLCQCDCSDANIDWWKPGVPHYTELRSGGMERKEAGSYFFFEPKPELSWSTFAKELKKMVVQLGISMLFDTDTYGVNYPDNMPPENKLLMTCAPILWDYKYPFDGTD